MRIVAAYAVQFTAAISSLLLLHSTAVAYLVGCVSTVTAIEILKGREDS